METRRARLRYDLEVDVENTAPNDWCGSDACELPNDRHSFDAAIDARDLEETYLAPFAGGAGGAAGVMCSYNAINGEPACTPRPRGRPNVDAADSDASQVRAVF